MQDWAARRTKPRTPPAKAQGRSFVSVPTMSGVDGRTASTKKRTSASPELQHPLTAAPSNQWTLRGAPPPGKMGRVSSAQLAKGRQIGSKQKSNASVIVDGDRVDETTKMVRDWRCLCTPWGGPDWPKDEELRRAFRSNC